MKTYTITVNGTVYDVTVEEGTAAATAPAAAPKAPVAPAAPAAPAVAPAAAPKAAPAANAAPKAAAGAGSVKVKASVPGKVCKVEASVDQTVKAGDSIEIKEKAKGSQRYKDILEVTGGRLVPAWLDVDQEALKGEVKALPTREEIDVPVNEMLIVELYSK